jgi:hypothetical protein
MFADPARGTLPLAWGINPTVFERSPHLLRWLKAVRGRRDFFVAYEGPGYIDANHVPDLEVLASAGEELYGRYNLSITGSAILSDFWLKPEAARAYARFSPNGVAIHPPVHHTGKRGLVEGMPIVHTSFHSRVFESDPQRLADEVIRLRREPPDFMMIRCILVTPGTVAATMERLGKEYVAVDPYVFFGMIRKTLEGR